MNDPTATNHPPLDLRADLPVIGLGWGAVVVLFALHTWLTFSANGQPTPFVHALAWSLEEWATWALLTPAVFALARRHPLGRRWLVSVPVHLGGAVAFSTAQIFLEAGLDSLVVATLGDASASIQTWLSDGARVGSGDFGYLFARKIGFDGAVYGTLVIAAHALSYARLSRVREMRAERLEKELVSAKLDALRSQLQPHFLFNTLNAVSELVHHDPAGADRMLADLAVLLRASLDYDGDGAVPFEREMELVDAYLAIQERRLGGRLGVERRIDPDTHGVQVPPLFLQPLVENAIRHGIEGRRAGGTLTLTAAMRREALVVEVADDGPGFSAERIEEGIGLGNTRRRLETLWGERARLTLSRSGAGGALVRVEIPASGPRPRAPQGPDPGRGRR